MRKLLLSLFFFLGCASIVIGQEQIDENKLREIVNLCHQIDSLYGNLNRLKIDTTNFHNQLGNLKKQWERTCNEYINNASNLTKEDFDSLIAKTYDDIDGPNLRIRLKDARNIAGKDIVIKTPVVTQTPSEDKKVTELSLVDSTVTVTTPPSQPRKTPTKKTVSKNKQGDKGNLSTKKEGDINEIQNKEK